MGWREAWERAERSVSERGSFADVPPADRIALARELLKETGRVVAAEPPPPKSIDIRLCVLPLDQCRGVPHPFGNGVDCDADCPRGPMGVLRG